MTKLFLFATLVSGMVLLGCKPKLAEQIKFSGLTETDKFGSIIGKPDSSDWRLDDHFTDREQSLFNAKYQGGALIPDNLKVTFFANPCRGESVFYIKKDSAVRLSVRLVDRDFNVLFTQDSIYDRKLLLNLNTLAMNDTLRLYYKFIDENQNEFNGHGDIYLWIK